MSMITAAQWVPRGFAAPFPKRYTLDEEEYGRIAELAKLKLGDAEEELQNAQKDGQDLDEDEDDDEDDDEDEAEDKMHVEKDTSNNKARWVAVDDDDLKEYDLDHYDDDDDDERQSGGQSMSMFGSTKSLAYYESNNDDPYITLKGDDADDEDREDLQILATDNLILSAKVEDEMAHLEVYVYEDDGDNLYVHHDIMLPAIPLSLERGREEAEEEEKEQEGSLGVSRRRRPLAGGQPEASQPAGLGLGRQDDQALGRQHGQVRQVVLVPHRQGVLLGLARDGTDGAAERELRPDDCRGRHEGAGRKGAEMGRRERRGERAMGSARQQLLLRVDGERRDSLPRHPKGAGEAGVDQVCVDVAGARRLWNITPTGPSMVVARNLDVGKVFATTFAPDAEVAFRLAVAGSSGSMHVWDTSTNPGVRAAFAQKVPALKEEAAEDRLIGVEDDDSSSSDEEEEEGQGQGQGQEDGESMDED
ncbi:hypothetical protein DCS_01130 [Drechmeria coniospora]|uniref:Transducin family protein n=1 Tax=Drechmeria coniospora TaxID=98403 RepID=A0A151GSA5_DRECN|nr:hypothetical protein DCS_01130 [Drechmeria coniospora]KYK59996.1 hypothetical protein DCS_01130 [Drechmeria coniospora]